jgi:hypothetical protein
MKRKEIQNLESAALVGTGKEAKISMYSRMLEYQVVLNRFMQYITQC